MSFIDEHFIMLTLTKEGKLERVPLPTGILAEPETEEEDQ